MHITDRINPSVKNIKPYPLGKTIDEIKRTYGLEHVVKLGSNESPIPPSAHVIKAIEDFLPKIARYPEDAAPKLKAQLAELNQVNPNQITLGLGSSEILELAIHTFAEAGDNIITSQYAFALYKILATTAGVETKVTDEHHFQQDFDAMLAAIDDRTKIIFITNPNNPTGTWVKAQPLKAFIQQVPAHVLIVVDEAYVEFMEDVEYESMVPMIASHDNVMVARTFSKAYGLGGLRFGYGIASLEVTELLNRVRKPFNVPSMTLVAASAALEDSAHTQAVIDTNRQGMQQMVSGLAKLNLHPITQTCNFLAVKIGPKAIEINQQLLERGVIVRPLAGYGLPEYLRISIGTQSENQFCLEQLQQLLA